MYCPAVFEDQKGGKYKSENKGLISVDRSNKATLQLTIPRSYLSRMQRIYRFKYLKLSYSNTPAWLFSIRDSLHAYDLGACALFLFISYKKR